MHCRKPRIQLICATWAGHECMVATLLCGNTRSRPCSRQSDIETSNMTLLKLHHRILAGHDDLCRRAQGPPVRV